jgi:uncharacterized protein
LIAISLALVGLPASAGQQAAPPKGYEFPALTGRVVDEAGLLPSSAASRIVGQSEALERATGHQFVTVTVRSLGGHPIEDYGMALGNYWGIGRKGMNDGVLLIVASNERKVRIEVGKGLETVLTNEEARQIIERDMLPAFRRGDLVRGIATGATHIVRELSPRLRKVA